MRFSRFSQKTSDWESQNRIAVSMSILAGAWAITVIGLIFLIFSNWTLSRKKAIYVQQPDGTTKIAKPFSYESRDTEVLKTTLRTWAKLTFEWDNRIPGSETPDPGWKVNETQKKIPSKSYAASFLLKPGFREIFLKRLANIIPQSVFQGVTSSHFHILFASEPRQIDSSPARYEQDLIAIRTDISASGERRVWFCKTVTMQAVEPDWLVLGKEEMSAFRKQLELLLRNGLLITDITEATTYSKMCANSAKKEVL